MVISPYQIPEMVLSIIAEVLVLFIIILLIKKHERKRKDEEDVRYEKGLIVFFVIGLFIYSFLIINSFFYQITPHSNIFVLVITMISLIIIVFTVELCVLHNTKFLITIIYTINVVLLLFFGIFFQISFYIPPLSLGNLALVFFLPALYYYIAIKGLGDLRKKSILMGTGFMGTLGGGATRSAVLISVNPSILQINPLYAHIFGPICMIIGLIILLYSFYSTL